MIPKPIYEALPIIYGISSILTMIMLDSIFSYMSGVLMGTAGIMVFYMRRSYRAIHGTPYTRQRFVN